jgi:hypothetical protein
MHCFLKPLSQAVTSKQLYEQGNYFISKNEILKLLENLKDFQAKNNS